MQNQDRQMARRRELRFIASMLAMLAMLAMLSLGCTEGVGTRVELVAGPESLSRARYLELRVFTSGGAAGSESLREEALYRFCERVEPDAAPGVPCLPVEMDLQRPFSLHLLAGELGPNARLRIEGALYDTQGMPSEADGPFSRIEAQAAISQSESHLLRVEFADACQGMMAAEAGRTCWNGSYRGSCYEAVPLGAPAEYVSEPNCGECGECTQGVCSARPAGSACGCEGDYCNDAGDCVVDAPVARVAVGYKHTCAVFQNDEGSGSNETSLYCWGSAHGGATGLGTVEERYLRPTPVPEETLANRVVDLDANGLDDGATRLNPATGTCAVVDGGGEVQCWGNRDFEESEPSRFLIPDPLDDERWRRVGVGGSHVCATTSRHRLFCWGSNGDRSGIRGQLGIGEHAPNVDGSYFFGQPQLVQNVDQSGELVRWDSLSVGRYHSCAMDTHARIFCWGMNETEVGGVVSEGEGTHVLSPRDMGESPSGAGWRQVSAGGWHTCALDHDGEVYCWGGNGRQNLGRGMQFSDTPTMAPVASNYRYENVDCGTSHCCAITRASEASLGRRTLVCWGGNSENGLGNGTEETRRPNGKAGSRTQREVLVPTPVSYEPGWAWLHLGEEHSCATRDDGSLWCWGENLEGQLGLGDRVNRYVPARVCLPRAVEEGS